MVKRCTSLVLGILVISATAAMAAEAPTATLYAGGSVNVNGNSVSGSTAVFDGDMIQTKSRSAVTLTANGSSVVVPENSSMTYSSGSVNLASGSAVIKTSRGMNAHIGAVTVAPSSNAARFAIQQHGNNVEIASLEGTVAISNGTKNVSLDAGHAVTLAMNTEPTVQGGGRGTTTTTTSGSGGAAGGGSSFSIIGVVAAVGAIVAATSASVIAARHGGSASASAP